MSGISSMGIKHLGIRTRGSAAAGDSGCRARALWGAAAVVSLALMTTFTLSGSAAHAAGHPAADRGLAAEPDRVVHSGLLARWGVEAAPRRTGLSSAWRRSDK